jgi:organic radical activating enzyme
MGQRRSDPPAGYCPPPSRWRDTPQRLRPAQVEPAVRSRDLQVLNLALSGGEPLAHPFLPPGLPGAELGFVVRVKSNPGCLYDRPGVV